MPENEHFERLIEAALNVYTDIELIPKPIDTRVPNKNTFNKEHFVCVFNKISSMIQ